MEGIGWENAEDADLLSSHVTFKRSLQTIVTKNNAGYTAAPVACRWAGAIFEVTLSFGQAFIF